MAKVLYIAGWGRSGTTILDSVLGQIDGIVSTGELANIWHRGLVRGRSCGCGRPVRDCPHWRDVFSAAFGGVDAVDPKEALAARAGLRTRHTRTVVANGHGYRQWLQPMYDALEKVTGAQVIVDSSKAPADAVVAASIEGHDVYVLHMVRDPRGVAYSWQRAKRSPDTVAADGLMTRIAIPKSSATWTYYNAMIMRHVRKAVSADRYRRLRYEDFAANPEGAVRDVLRFLGETAEELPVVGSVAHLRISHTASGNPSRFQTGDVPIEADDEWRKAMSRRDKATVTALSLPLLRRLGYPLHP